MMITRIQLWVQIIEPRKKLYAEKKSKEKMISTGVKRVII